ncbi:MAG: hypothetical protein ABI140_20750 [Jatrophihabitantaceae bacterium]
MGTATVLPGRYQSTVRCTVSRVEDGSLKLTGPAALVGEVIIRPGMAVRVHR